jgi:hypothetical protein
MVKSALLNLISVVKTASLVELGDTSIGEKILMGCGFAKSAVTKLKPLKSEVCYEV